jgi:hypothetical protein
MTSSDTLMPGTPSIMVLKGKQRAVLGKWKKQKNTREARDVVFLPETNQTGSFRWRNTARMFELTVVHIADVTRADVTRAGHTMAGSSVGG